MVTPVGEQIECVNQIADFVLGSEQIFVLTGPAGSGKSYLIPLIERLVIDSGRGVEVCAPTGQAAKRLRSKGIEAGTVHHALYGEPDVGEAPTEEKPPTFWFRFRGLTTKTVFIVDEASMIGDQPYTEREREESEVLFEDGELRGDLLKNVLDKSLDNKIIFIGDLKQLPPVKSTVSPCLDGNILRSEGFLVREYHLSAIRRTNEESNIRRISDFCADGGKIGLFPSVWERTGEVERAPVFGPVADLNCDTFANGETVAIAATNRTVDTYNKLVRRSIYRGLEEVDGMADGVLPKDRMVLARQCPLMYLRSGDEFTVEEIHPEGDQVIAGVRGAKDVHLQHITASINEIGSRFIFDTYLVKESLTSLTNDHDITKVLWVDYLSRCRKLNLNQSLYLSTAMIKKDRYFNAFRAKFSYVRTCHKAQGGEWKTVIVDTTDPMTTEASWGYTAATRASESLVVISPMQQTSTLLTNSMDQDRLLEEIIVQLAVKNFELIRIKTIDHGCQVRISVAGNSENSGLVNLYFKDGSLTNLTQTGAWSAETKVILSGALDALTDLSRRSTEVTFDVPPFVIELLERMKLSAKVNHDADFVWSVIEEWTVSVTLSQGVASGSTFYRFGGKRKGLTAEKIDGRHKPNGDIDQIQLIRMLKETRGL